MTSEDPRGTKAIADGGNKRVRVRVSIIDRIGKILGSSSVGKLIVPNAEQVTLTEKVRVAWQDEPFALLLGRVTLEVHPDIPLSGNSAEGSREWIIHSGDEFYQGVPRYMRIKPGETVILGCAETTQAATLGLDSSVAGRHAKISNRNGSLEIQPLELDRPTRIHAIDSPVRMWAARRANLARMPQVIGRELSTFDHGEALELIQDINGLLADEAYRERDDYGLPGGVVQFPEDKTILILGDVHTRADNVLSALAQGGTLAALERGEACVVLLGDLVHSEDTNALEHMESSVFILDLFCMLKRRFPDGVFYVHGNHESFSPDVGKAGVPQGILLRKHLKKLRGKRYVAEVETLFSRLAFVVTGNDFVACHGGPVRSTVNRSTLVNIGRYPGIQHELVWNRVRQRNRPQGYGKGSVKRFRKTLNVSVNAPMFVGHTPLSRTETLWLNAGGVANHHIIYSAHADRAAAVVVSKGQATTLEFIPDPALSYLRAAGSTQYAQ